MEMKENSYFYATNIYPAMKKSIAFFTFLCLTVGTISAKGLIDTQKLEYSIPYIPKSK